ncbi:hypothetical protein PG5_32930 [Pseudomonas sp. G5(2012)]|nr:hypothetical protein PG5_32930 [Pseudomonas sp. G5(2012)]
MTRLEALRQLAVRILETGACHCGHRGKRCATLPGFSAKSIT